MASATAVPAPDEATYRRGVTAWVGYDWANSAFAVVVVTVVLPLYFSSVAGATLSSPASATQLFALVTSVTVVLAAVMSPFVGAWTDLVGTRKVALAVLVGLGATATAGLWLVTEGRWLVALVLFGIGRLAFVTGNVIYDGLLPAVSRVDDRGAISAGGYAAGSVGGAVVLTVVGILMLLLPDAEAARWAFLLVGVWWAGFSVPLFRRVAEPSALAPAAVAVGPRQVGAEVARVVRTVASRPPLWRFLLAYVVSSDAINVVVALAVLYGAELGFSTPELLGAVLLVQVVGGPFTVMFGRLATDGASGRGPTAVLLVANLVLLPAAGIGLGLLGPPGLVGRAGPDYETSPERSGQGPVVLAPLGSDQARPTQVDPSLLGADEPVPAMDILGTLTIPYTGRDVTLTHAVGPDAGTLEVFVDARAGERRFGRELTARVADAGPHDLTVRSTGGMVTVTEVEVLPPPREARWWAIAAVLALVQVLAFVLASLVGRYASGWADTIDERRGIMLALAGYVVIAVWGFRLDTAIEFWALAWMVAVVQGGAQSLFRSLFVGFVPRHRGGEFFGLFSSLTTVASFVSPLLFVVSVALWGSSRPALLALAGVFALAIHLVRGTASPTSSVVGTSPATPRGPAPGPTAGRPSGPGVTPGARPGS